jgi:hypothetical protein
MRVAQRTGDTLVIEEGAGANAVLAAVFIGIGVVGISIGWMRGQYLIVFVASIFLFYGLKIFLYSRTKTHRFDRARRVIVIESTGRSGTTRREVTFDDVADVVLEKARKSHAHYVYLVTRQGERLRMADSYDGSRENTVDCFNAAREWLGMEAK